MFGHNDDENSTKQDAPQGSVGGMPPVVPDPSVTAAITSSTLSPAPGPDSTEDTPSAPSVPGSSTGPNVVEPTTDTAPAEAPSDSEPSGELSTHNSSALASDTSVVSDDDSNNTEETNSASEPATDTDSSPADSELMTLKQQALQQLSPLVDHLDQTPEEKFRTTMMMIQASDDSTLVKAAFEAAGAISDDKVRAQALLDVINEINYFTQHKAE